jgi:hypothetical protein
MAPRFTGTRTALGPAFGSGNSYTVNIANSNYNAVDVTAQRKASDVTFLVAYTFPKAIDDFFRFWRVGEFFRLPAQPFLIHLRHDA